MEALIGEIIIEAFVKAVGARGNLKFSFAGNYKLGLSRWGFTGDSFQYIYARCVYKFKS